MRSSTYRTTAWRRTTSPASVKIAFPISTSSVRILAKRACSSCQASRGGGRSSASAMALIAEEVSDLREDRMKMPMRCWRMKRLSRLCTRHWGSGVPRAVAAAVGACRPTWCKQVHEGPVRIARDKGVTAGRRLRLDTKVVETDISSYGGSCRRPHR
jgi:hypothetical protein